VSDFALRSESGAVPGVLVLSIQPMHVDRVFRGAKRFELRRRLPKNQFTTAYLYETGGRGIVGYFDVAGIHEASVPNLWKVVGTAATSKERFDRYFSGVDRGFAIEIRNPTRFKAPVTVKEVQRVYPRFRPPQGSLWLRDDHPICRLLAARRENDANPPAGPEARVVTLRPIKASEKALYTQWVTAEIARNYDEIYRDFAEFNLQVHEAGVDPFGFFTRSKEVLSIENERQQHIGFTTLTEKRGGAVKTGPTILAASSRGRGYGAAVRRAIEERVSASGARKLYCSAPDVAPDVLSYLLRSGMRVEAHLERHYTERHGEFILGKVLRRETRVVVGLVRRTRGAGILADPRSLSRVDLVEQMRTMFAATWFPVDKAFMTKLVASALSARAIEPKPKSMVAAASLDECVAAVLLVEKRGGSSKALLLRATDHAPTLRLVIAAAESEAQATSRRKLYFLHPVEDSAAVHLLRSLGYLPEGVLREPYVPEQDVLVLSKFIPR
jgi:predicted transcriptional regulator